MFQRENILQFPLWIDLCNDVYNKKKKKGVTCTKLFSKTIQINKSTKFTF